MKTTWYAFLWALGLAVCSGLVMWLALRSILPYGLWVYLLAFTGYTILASYIDAANELWRRLGRKKRHSIITKDREIPIISGVFESSIVKSQTSDRFVEMYDSFDIVTPDGDTIHFADIREFIKCAWLRQVSGQAPFSRVYWTRHRRDRMPTAHYDAIMEMLVSGGYVLDRRKGKSGRLVTQPNAVIEMINRKVRL